MYKDIAVATIALVPGKNARKHLNIDQALIRSIKEVGIINPITVKQNGKGYEIVAGHRRYAAAKKADLQEIPCRLIDENHASLIGLIENDSRNDLTDMEYAEAFAKLANYEDAHIAKLFGKTSLFVRQRRALAELDKELKILLERHQVGFDIANTLTRLSWRQQKELAHDTEVDWSHGAWQIHRHINSATQLKTDNVLFDQNKYEGNFVSDLFSENPESLIFEDQAQAKTLQEVSVESWRAKLEAIPYWDFCHIITSNDSSTFWKNYELRAESHDCQKDHPATLTTMPRKKVAKEFRTAFGQEEIGVLAVVRNLTNINWIPFVTIKKGKAQDVKKSTVEKDFTFGPTAKEAFAAHKTDLVRKHMLEDKGFRVVMAAVVCELAGIQMSQQPHSWGDKIKDRTSPDFKIPMYYQPSEFFKVIDSPKLPQMFMSKVVGSIFDDRDYFGAVDVLAKHYGIKVAKEFFPTAQILKLMPLVELKKIFDKFKMKGAFKTKKDLVNIILNESVKNKLTWCPSIFEFKTRNGSSEQELDDHIPVE